MNNEKYFVVNAGSSSLKFQLFEIDDNGKEQVIAKGTVEKIGKDNSEWKFKDGNDTVIEKDSYKLANHLEAVKKVLSVLIEKNIINKDLSDLKGIGHRVLHGLDKYDRSVIINEEVKNDIKAFTPLGPLHHPGELACINCFETLLPNIPQVAVFDTAFHQTIPPHNYMYPVQYEYYDKYKVRRYGFHGTSHKYITETVQNFVGRKDINIISCHLGSGASLCAIKNGKSINTTMGLTPLDGLMMGTRCGSVDPSIGQYIHDTYGIAYDKIYSDYNYQSGLLGISGVSNDWREVEEAANNGNLRAQLAAALLVKSIVKEINAYIGEIGNSIEAIVFTAGMGENSESLRRYIIYGYEYNYLDEKSGETKKAYVPGLKQSWGICLDDELNAEIASFKSKQDGIISNDFCNIKVIVIPTNEELMIMRDTVELVKEKEQNKTLIKR